MNNDIKKKLAFTLAEVLIALSILGVVAAITIPNVIQNYKRTVLKTQLKSTYSDLEQVSRLFFITNSISIPNYARNSGYFKVLDKIIDNQYIKTKSTKAQNINMNSFFCSKYKNLNRGSLSGCNFDDGYLKDIKGRDWFASSSYNKVAIDINGYEKGPNRLGIDVFGFIFESNGEISLPAVQYRCTKNAEYAKSGLDCTQYAFEDVYPNNNSKNYWKDFLNSL